MTGRIDGIAILVFIVVLVLTAFSGLIISRLQTRHPQNIEEWGLGGRQFGTLITWFLVGGDFYTAYTIIAIPGIVFGMGAEGFFALPYTILVYPFVFVTMPRLWTVARRHGLVTSADFVKVRYGSRTLASAIAFTGIVALMPYIALQFIGIEVVVSQMIGTSGSHAVEGAVLFVAFAGVAAFTFSAGLRAPALIAVAKDIMIYIVVIAAVTMIPHQFGGYRQIFHSADTYFRNGTGALILHSSGASAYSSLALGSALAAFMYPHTMTSVLASSSPTVIRKNAFLLPIYTLLLGLIAMLGIVGAAAGLQLHSSKDVVPALFALVFPSWFRGFSFAAIAVAALVPASIMCIAGANLFTRNLFLEYRDTKGEPRQQAAIARYASVAIGAFALAFALFLPAQYAVNFQLLGGILILQTFPAIVFGLWKRLFHHGALLLGLTASLCLALALLYCGKFQTSNFVLSVRGNEYPVYIGILALMCNLAVVALASPILDAFGPVRHVDGSSPADYVEDTGYLQAKPTLELRDCQE